MAEKKYTGFCKVYKDIKDRKTTKLFPTGDDLIAESDHPSEKIGFEEEEYIDEDDFVYEDDFCDDDEIDTDEDDEE